ncbi:hypothetical protein GT030_14780, partial [Streptomyces sp. SID1328]|nr:hypothetical protein [Streptomyces sp. SID1328]
MTPTPRKNGSRRGGGRRRAVLALACVLAITGGVVLALDLSEDEPRSPAALPGRPAPGPT